MRSHWRLHPCLLLFFICMKFIINMYIYGLGYQHAKFQIEIPNGSLPTFNWSFRVSCSQQHNGCSFWTYLYELCIQVCLTDGWKHVNFFSKHIQGNHLPPLPWFFRGEGWLRTSDKTVCLFEWNLTCRCIFIMEEAI